MVEWIGYAASVLVAISITIKGGIYFRVFNFSGAVCFLVYGILIKTWPVVIINAYGIIINLFHIIISLKTKESGMKKATEKNDADQAV